MRISLSKLIGVVFGLSLVLACSVSALADNSQILTPETIVSGIVKENIQKFTGSPNEVITYNGLKELPHGKVYEVTTKTGRFYVNTKTGDIESAIIRNGLSASSINAKNLDSMKAQVKAFAEKNYKNFTSKKMVLTESRIIDHGDAGKEYLFIWNEIVGEAYTQSTVQISVLPDWNNSITYVGIDRPLLVNTTPEVSRDDAQEKTLRAFDMGASAKTQSKLVVIPFDNNQKLVWIIDTIELDKDNMSRGGTVTVDAVSGNVLSTNPLQ